MTALSLEKRAAEVLQKTGMLTVPIPIHLVAQRLGLLLEAVSLGDEVSGVLVVEGDHGVIGYNASHSQTRQRFTIAHEIAHYVLHRTEGALFIDDRTFAAFRDQRSSFGADKHERQANAFAAALLMPTNLVLREIEHRRFELSDDESLSDLARAFQVSVQAMVYRLANIGVLTPSPDVGDLALHHSATKGRPEGESRTRR